MRKIPCKYENPIDNILISICEYTCPFAYKLGLTPNILTTISILFCGICIVFLCKLYYLTAALFFFISYYFDCMDGHFARKYNQTTKFGDYYDHFADITKISSVLYTLFTINSIYFWKYIPYIGILFTLSGIHIGCQEIYYNKPESPSLSILQNMCPINKNSYIMQFTRFFGVGTAMMGIIIMILLFK